VLLPLLILVVFAVQRRVTAPAWPFSARCGWMRARGRGIALGTPAFAVAFIGYALPRGAARSCGRTGPPRTPA
jgi:hypothetical protein